MSFDYNGNTETGTSLQLAECSVSEMNVFNVELHFGFAVPMVFLELIDQVEMVAAAHALVVFAQLETDGRIALRAFVEGYWGKLQMLHPLCADHARITGID